MVRGGQHGRGLWSRLGWLAKNGTERIFARRLYSPSVVSKPQPPPLKVERITGAHPRASPSTGRVEHMTRLHQVALGVLVATLSQVRRREPAMLALGIRPCSRDAGRPATSDPPSIAMH